MLDYKRKKVLIMIPYLGEGGIEILIKSWLNDWEQDKYIVDVFAQGITSKRNLNIFKSLGVNVYESPYTNKCIIKKMQYFSMLLQKEKYDIVHLNTCFAPEALFLAQARQLKVSVRIAHGHNANSYKKNWRQIVQILFRPIMRQYATLYTGCSEEAAIEIIGKKGIQSNKYKLLKNGIDTEKFKFNSKKRDEIRQMLGIENKYVIGHVGRFTEQKNHRFLIDIFCEFTKKNSNSILLLVGEGELKEIIKQKVNSLELADKVIFAGVVDNVNEYLFAMDFFLFPSLYEGFGIAFLEAECTGLPALASAEITDKAFICENVYKNSLSDDASDWCEKIVDISKNTQVINNRQNASSVIKEKKYDIHDCSIFELYEEAERQIL